MNCNIHRKPITEKQLLSERLAIQTAEFLEKGGSIKTLPGFAEPDRLKSSGVRPPKDDPESWRELKGWAYLVHKTGNVWSMKNNAYLVPRNETKEHVLSRKGKIVRVKAEDLVKKVWG